MRFKVSTALLTAMLLFAVAALFNASPAQALCADPAEDGIWHNVDANTRGITRAEIGFVCGDVVLNGRPARTYYPIRLFGACSPVDCNWGEIEGERRADGWIYGTYDFGWSTKHVWVKAYDGGWLRVWIWTDFHDGRTDYASNNWLR